MVYFKFLEPAIFQLSKEYDKREKAIKSCVGVLSQKVNALRKEREENMDDFDLMRKLRKEQTKVNIYIYEFQFQFIWNEDGFLYHLLQWFGLFFASSFKKRTVNINIHSYQLGGSRICFDLIYNIRVISPNTKLSNASCQLPPAKGKSLGC